MLKRIFLIMFAAITGVVAVLIVNTLSFTPASIEANQSVEIEPENPEISEHLAEAIRFKTISSENPDDDYAPQFDAFIGWLQSTYPDIFNNLSLERINRYTLVFHWKAPTSGPAVLLSAHYDVVPVNPETIPQWTHKPFDGVIKDGYIWGRGALDDKSAVIAIMEAVSTLIQNGNVPTRDVYIALTHDEEMGSELGSQALTDYFKQHQIDIAWSLDEGSFVLSGIVPGIDKGIASINVGEKGYLTLRLTAKGEGGHSSMPPKETAVSLLAESLVALNHATFPGGLDGITEQMYSNIARHMDFSKRLLFANMWLFTPLLESILDNSNSGNAMLRTTVAPTMLVGSIKSNVLPATASATINFRLHPRDSIAKVKEWVSSTINDDRIVIDVQEAFEPSTLASSTAKGFVALSEATATVYPDAIITPGLTIAATDSRFYSQITNAYRFNPMVITPDDLDRIHGTDERISVKNMVNAVRFYEVLLKGL